MVGKVTVILKTSIQTYPKRSPREYFEKQGVIKEYIQEFLDREQYRSYQEIKDYLYDIGFDWEYLRHNLSRSLAWGTEVGRLKRTGNPFSYKYKLK